MSKKSSLSLTQPALEAGAVEIVAEQPVGEVTVVTVRFAVKTEDRYLGNIFARRGGIRDLPALISESIAGTLKTWVGSINRIIIGKDADDSGGARKIRTPSRESSPRKTVEPSGAAKPDDTGSEDYSVAAAM
jgi:hypothetical protein